MTIAVELSTNSDQKREKVITRDKSEKRDRKRKNQEKEKM